MALTDTDNPDLTTVSIRLPNADVEFQHFLAYEYDEHFLTPSDAWWFDLDQDELTSDQLALLIPGQPVQVYVSGLAQSYGYIDDVETRCGSGGTVIHVEGRDWLAPAVDSQIDPRIQFNAGQTVLQIVQAVFAPFGVSPNFVLGDNAANVNAITGAIYGTRTSKTGKALKNVVAHQLKPYPREGAFAFAARVCQREGLWIWPASDGKTLIVGQPDYTQDPIYQLQHSRSNAGANNVIDSTVRFSRKEQPSIILASGVGGGGEFSKAALRVAILNPYIIVDTSAIQAAYPGIQILKLQSYDDSGLGVHQDKVARPLYLYDPESHNMDELVAFARREMSLKMRQAVQAKYTIEGHRLGGYPIGVNTMIAINDDRSNLHTVGWVLSRNFSKSAGGGTKTKIEVIRPYSLQF